MKIFKAFNFISDMEQQDIETQLWQYIDGICDANAQVRIARLIATDDTWKSCYDQLIALHKDIPAYMTSGQPSMRFTKNVMDIVAAPSVPAPSTRSYINPTVVRTIAAFFIISIISFLAYAIAIADQGTGKSYLPDIKLDYMANNTMLHLLIWGNIVIGLLLLDTIFRKRSVKGRYNS